MTLLQLSGIFLDVASSSGDKERKYNPKSPAAHLPGFCTSGVSAVEQFARILPTASLPYSRSGRLMVK
jgi:hypothetical protein